MLRRTLLLMVVLCLGTARADAAKNVMLIIADDLGMEVGCYGDKTAKTPNIDALAAAGTRFPLGFASVASCSPSRATMLTGQPTHQNGQYGLAHAEHNAHSFRKTKSLPGLLGSAGYQTAVLAKFHVQPKEVYPFTEEIPAGGGRNPVAIAEAARKFIKASGEKPFLLHVGFTDPHRAARGFANEGKYPTSVPRVKFDPKTVRVPHFLPDLPEVREDMADYYESVARLDYGVGLLMKVLEETKADKDTLVLFISDNGIPFPGAKTTLYDSGLNLPLIVRKPGQKAGVVCDAMASWTDLAPTILDWAGLSKPDAMRGRSLLPVLEQTRTTGWNQVFASHQYHEVTMYYPMRMVRTRTHKLIVNLASGLEYPSASDLWNSPTWQAILKDKVQTLGSRSLQAFLHRPKEELYDMVNDPKETKNLASDPSQAAVLADLRKQLTDWRKATNDIWLVKDIHE